MAKMLTRREPVRLSFEDGEVVVTPKDRSIFCINAEKATEACRSAVREEERVEKFTQEVILPLRDWCRKHQSEVSACYVTVPQSAVLPIYIVGASEVYDFDLTAELSDLAFWFDEQGWSVHLSQLPRCDKEQLYGYFHIERALEVYA